MIANIFIAALTLAWFLLIGYLAIKVFDKEFQTRQSKGRSGNKI